MQLYTNIWSLKGQNAFYAFQTERIKGNTNSLQIKLLINNCLSYLSLREIILNVESRRFRGWPSRKISY